MPDILNKKFVFFHLLLVTIIFTGCNTLPGDGGTSTISGKVFVQEYNASGTLFADYYGADQHVYLIYGDGTVYDDDTRTSYDGSFEFPFLRKGSYQIFAYSDCIGCDGGSQPVILNIEITDNHQTVTAPDLMIDKRN